MCVHLQFQMFQPMLLSSTNPGPTVRASQQQDYRQRLTENKIEKEMTLSNVSLSYVQVLSLAFSCCGTGLTQSETMGHRDILYHDCYFLKRVLWFLLQSHHSELSVLCYGHNNNTVCSHHDIESPGES